MYRDLFLAWVYAIPAFRQLTMESTYFSRPTWSCVSAFIIAYIEIGNIGSTIKNNEHVVPLNIREFSHVILIIRRYMDN